MARRRGVEPHSQRHRANARLENARASEERVAGLFERERARLPVAAEDGNLPAVRLMLAAGWAFFW